jgi:hypothetical protein
MSVHLNLQQESSSFKEGVHVVSVFAETPPQSLDTFYSDPKYTLCSDDWYTLLKLGLLNVFPSFNSHQQMGILETLVELSNAKE